MAQGAIINVPDEYTSIQQAITNAKPDDVIIVSYGLYNEHIVVDKRLNIMGLEMPEINGQEAFGENTVTLAAEGITFNGFSVTGGGSSAAGIGITADNVEVRNCTVTSNKGTGIEVNNVNGAIIHDSVIRDNVEGSSLGIYLYSSTNCLLQDNTLVNNNVYNLELNASSHNIIHNNTFSSAGWHGVAISDSSQYNILSGNIVEETNYGHGIYIDTSDNNILRENTIRNNSPDSSSYAGMCTDAVLNLTFEDNILSGNNRHGIYLYDCDNSFFSNNTITGTINPEYADDSAGFYLYSSHWNTLENNTITENEHRGLFLQDSRYNTLKDNIISGNPYNFGVTVYSYTPYFINYIDTSNLVDGKPIIYLLNELNPSINGTSNAGAVYCINCEGATVEGLTLSNNSYGVVFSNSVNSTIENNTVLSCVEGIYLIEAENNTITNNYVSSSLDYGIRVKNSNSNSIYLNDFVDSEYKDYRSDGSVTLWKSPVELLYYFAGSQYTNYLGNHWGSYTGIDDDNDGIGDTAFSITNDNDDEFPLNASRVSYSFAPNQPPSASFTYLPLYPDTDDTISFTDHSTDIDGSITSWLWNFGDGGTSSLQDPSHQYSGPGFYQVQLDVTDDQMATGNTTCIIFVHDAGPMTIYVPDNFSTIQEAINISRDGDTVVVRQGTYPENVVVNRSITLTGEGMPLVTASDGNGITVTSPDCTIEGFNVSDFDWDDYAGIKLLSDRNTVRNNVLYDNDFGIWLILSDNNSIFNNTCTDNHYSGIQLTSSMNNTIYNNTCNNNSAYVGGEGGDGYGIMLEDSGGNILYFNDMDNPSQMVPGTYYNAFDSNTSAIPNQWFNATILKGNRYSDYGGEDGNNDGIGDSDYEIACNLNYALPSVDPYPLMPYNPLPEYEPVISSIWTSDLTYSSINIRWSILNDVNSDNRILYGTSASLAGSQWSAWDNSTVTPHISLAGLVQNTTYYYSCYSYNSKNTTLVDNSSIRSFTTIQRQNMILTVDDDNSDIPEPPANYSSLSAALSAAIDGDTILVYNGTYKANHIVDKSVNITGVGQPLLIGSDPDTYSELGNVVALEANDCILQGFRISEAHWTYPNIYGRKDSACVRIDSDRNVVRNNILEDGVYGIYVSTGSNYNRITSNLLNDTYDGVLFDYARNNVFSDNELTNIDRYPVMLDKPDYMSYDYYPSTNNTISNNILSDTGFSYGITVGGVSDNTIADNTLSYSNRIWISGDGNSVTGNFVQGPHDHHDAGIQLGSGEYNSLSDNTVTWQRFGILLEPGAEYVTMRNNRMENNTYNFGFTGDWYYEGNTASTHDIDTSNTVDGNPIYYLVGEEDAVYSYSTLVPSPGYLACIDCSNITIKDFYLEKNAQGLFLYNTTDSRIDSVTTISNAEYGILLHETDNLVITDSSTNGNGEGWLFGGIFMEESSGCLIDNCAILGNDEIGITLWYGCPDTVIRNSEITNNGDPADPGSGIGIYISGSDAENVTVHSNIIANTYAELQGTGIKNWAKNSTIYNNYFDNTEPKDVYSAASGTVWNITPTIGTNIIGGPWIAGNYWEDYEGVDSDGDGLGDTLVPYTADGEIQEAGDYHPLLDTFVPDSIPPVLYIINPVEGEEYIPQQVSLKVFSPDRDAAYWWYSLNGAENMSLNPGATLSGLPLGENTLIVYLNDSSGNMNSSVVNFTVAEDHTAPEIHIVSPENGFEYNESWDVPLKVWSPDEDVFSWWCSIDGQSNTSFTPNATLKGLSNGVHTLIVYADDVVGNTNSSQVTFTVNVDEEENPPSGGGGGSGTGGAVIISPGEESSEEDEEDEEELLGDYLIILSPEEGRTVSRNVELRYACTIPLARAYYSLDGGAEKEVDPLAPVPVKRLKLGKHIFRVTGVDYEGNRYHASAKFEVIPLALGEKPDVGSPEYPDEAVYAFNGRAANYTLTFEASGLEEGELGVYINRYLSGSSAAANGVSNENEVVNPVPLLSLHESGGLLGTLNSSESAWQTYGYTIPANRVVPEAENFLSFIHQNNPGTVSGSNSWHVRNVALVPEMPLSYPRIRVFTPDRALSPEDEMMAWVEISGIGEAGGSSAGSAGSYSGNGADNYEASVYVVGPDGTVRSFPDRETAPVPLAQSYLEENHYGRIPGAMAFDESFLPGTYTLVGILSSLESGKPVSISSEVIYYSDQPSVKLFLNRNSFYPGMPLTIEAALTEGKTPESVSVLTRLERPAGADLFLPEKTGTFSMLNYASLEDGYMTLYNEPVNGNWENGTYVVKCSLFNESGYELASDVLSFEVSTAESELSVRFDMPEDILFPVVKSNIRLIDAASFGVIAEKSTTGPQSSVDLQAPPGTYWIAGVIYTENGDAYRIPVSESNRVELGCDEKRTKKVSVSRISFVDFVNMLNEEVEA